MGSNTTLPATPYERRFAQAFGLALRVLRQSRSLTLRAFGDRANCSSSQLDRYETGASLPTMPTLLRLLSSIGATYETFTKMHLLAIKLFTLAGPEMTLEAGLPSEEEDG